MCKNWGVILIRNRSKRFNLWPYLATILMALNTANSFVHRCLVRLTDHKEGSKNPYRVLSNDPSYTKITYSFVVCTHNHTIPTRNGWTDSQDKFIVYQIVGQRVLIFELGLLIKLAQIKVKCSSLSGNFTLSFDFQSYSG